MTFERTPELWELWLTIGGLVFAVCSAAGLALRATALTTTARRLDAAGPASSVESMQLPSWLSRPIERAALGVAPVRLVAIWAAVVVAVSGTGMSTGVPAAGLLAGLAATVVSAGALWLLRHRRDRLIEAELPAGLEAMGRSLRSGASFPQAFGEAAGAVSGPLAADLIGLDQRLGLGQPLARVLREWSTGRDLAGVRLAAAALGFSAEAGGSRSRAIDGLADSLRDRAALDREIAALASQARMSGIVIAVLPVGFVFVSSTLDPEVSAFLFQTPLGLGCLVLGIALDLIGFAWMHRMSSTIDGSP